MKYFIIFSVTLLSSQLVWAQPVKKPAKPQQQSSSQPDINKMMEEAMKNENMSEADKEQMRKTMNGMMPAMNEINSRMADYPEFSKNTELVPKKDAARIAAMSKKALTKAEIPAYANNLYNKIMLKGDAAEMAIVKKVIAETPQASAIGNAALLAMMQGHPQAALALSIKAVISDPANLNWQNNMAALLTNYGYPEQAIPVLRKLKTDIPGNSTILNNIGYAWLGLGATDSAQRYFGASVRINPNHHEANAGKGLTEEAKGDHSKAGDTYENAIEISPNPFINQMLKNNKGSKAAGNLDFEKIKKNIAIYEYFPKGWMKDPPALSNNVKNYNEDLGMIKGYKEMIREMGDRIQDISKTLQTELDDLTKKGETEFVNEMMNANQKGLSFMSKPATVVLGVLSAYNTKWQMDFSDTIKKIYDWKVKLERKREADIEEINNIIYNGKSNATCEQYKGQLDKIENDFMSKVNPLMRDLLIRKSEEYRQWLNAWCTWNWYVTGNIKNIILIQDVSFTQYLAGMYTTIVTAMEVTPEHCNSSMYDAEQKIDAPPIPNFVCPAVVSIPFGSEWQGLVAAAKDFNDNQYKITKTDKPVPNVSVAYGTSDMVAQPGIAPSVKTANGSVFPGNINNDDDDLVPLSSLGSGDHTPGTGIKTGDHSGNPTDDDLVPLPSYLGQELAAKMEREKARSKMVKDLLSKMMETNCEGEVPRPKTANEKRLEKLFKEAADRMRKEIEEEKNNIDPKIKKFEELANDFVNKMVKDRVKEALEVYKKIVADNDPSHFKSNVNEFDKILNNIYRLNPSGLDQVQEAMTAVNNMKKDAVRMSVGPAALNDIGQNGIQPTISSGLQAQGTFNMSRTMFQ